MKETTPAVPTASFARLAPRAALALALALPAAVLSATTDAHAQQGRSWSMPQRPDLPLGLRPVEPATEVGVELSNPFFQSSRFAIAARPYFGFRLRSPWEIYFTIPVTLVSYSNATGIALGNIEVMALHRIDFGPNFRMSLAFGGFVPTPSCYNWDPNAPECITRYDGLWSTGGYMPGYYQPGALVAHFHLGFDWNPGRGIFTLSWEVGNEARIRINDNGGWYRRAVDLSVFGAVYASFRVHRVLSIGGGVRLYDWFTAGNDPYVNGEPAYWEGAWSGVFGLRFHAGVFEPGVGVVLMAPGPTTDGRLWNGGATLVADLRARWY